MENHHEDPKPANKWIATPIVAAFIVIALVVTFIQASSGQFSKCSNCKVPIKNSDQHDKKHEDGQSNVKSDENATDTSKTTNDSTKVVEVHEDHGH